MISIQLYDSIAGIQRWANQTMATKEETTFGRFRFLGIGSDTDGDPSDKTVRCDFACLGVAQTSYKPLFLDAAPRGSRALTSSSLRMVATPRQVKSYRTV